MITALVLIAALPVVVLYTALAIRESGRDI